VIAIPTDTVYGIAASLEHPAAVERLFDVKGRSGTKAIPILVSSREALERLSVAAPQSAMQLVDRFWPGALTIVVTADENIPDAVLRGGRTVAVRMPACGDALEIISGAGGALAVTSANRSGDSEARSADEVRFKLGGRIDYVVDGGPSPETRPSTVVDVTHDPPRILRSGVIGGWEVSAALKGSG
jgi:L-threonylcarbamoyladenylate synthase